MFDLTRPWPLGLGEKRWWIAVSVAIVLLGVAFAIDHQFSLYAQSWPEPIRNALAEVTPYGESGWILIPAGVLYVVTALVRVLRPLEANADYALAVRCAVRLHFLRRRGAQPVHGDHQALRRSRPAYAVRHDRAVRLQAQLVGLDVSELPIRPFDDRLCAGGSDRLGVAALVLFGAVVRRRGRRFHGSPRERITRAT